jgi:hypothetical protein
MAKNYYRGMFNPFTYALSLEQNVTKWDVGRRYERLSNEIKIGDTFIFYIMGICRFGGIADVGSKFEKLNDGISYQNDPYHLQCDLKNIILLPIEQTISIREPIIWNNLSITKDLEKGSNKWTSNFMGSISRWKYQDGQLIENIIKQQQTTPQLYPLNTKEQCDYNYWIKREQCRINQTPFCETPKIEQEDLQQPQSIPEVGNGKTYYKSSEIQALISKIGYIMGFKIWNPPHDRPKIKEISKLPEDAFVTELPYDVSSIAQQIDVLWVNGRSIVRAFEIEGTTAVYSGMLRMSDLIEENPNLHTDLHIVASSEDKEKVFKQLMRPTFNKLQLSCSYLSYENIERLANNEDLEYIKQSIIDKYAEYPEPTE